MIISRRSWEDRTMISEDGASEERQKDQKIEKIKIFIRIICKFRKKLKNPHY